MTRALIPDAGCCEHGDHPAPAGRRFCSPECARCERQYDPEDPRAAHICGARHDRKEPQR